MPKSDIVLSERRFEGKGKHLEKDGDGRVILIAEKFYEDFVVACMNVCEMEFQNDDKMNRPFLTIKKALCKENGHHIKVDSFLNASTSSALRR